MQIQWQITDADKARVADIVDRQQNGGMVRYRERFNLAAEKEEITKDRLWRTIVCMRLTTRARTRPRGALADFQKRKPFLLSYDTMRLRQLDQAGIHYILKAHKVGTDPQKISAQLAENFNRLEEGKWQRALDQCGRLKQSQPREVEREVADCLEDILIGIGPKQARNVLQALCLTRYEIPIDSRVTNWLNEELSFPIRISSSALSDRNVYRLILDGICALCKECGIYPCILDAAIFGSIDGEDWDDELQRY